MAACDLSTSADFSSLTKSPIKYKYICKYVCTGVYVCMHVIYYTYIPTCSNVSAMAWIPKHITQKSMI